MSRSFLFSLLVLIAVMAATYSTPQPVTKGSLVLENMVRVAVAAYSGR